MLTIFPDLLNWSLVAPLLIRLALAAISLWGAKTASKAGNVFVSRFTSIGFKNPDISVKIFAFFYAIAGLSLLLGFYTQIGAMLFLVLSATMLAFEKKLSALTPRDVMYYILLFVCSASLLVLGAGFLAFDLPL